MSLALSFVRGWFRMVWHDVCYEHDSRTSFADGRVTALWCSTCGAQFWSRPQ